MHQHHFNPPQIVGAKNAKEWLAAFLIWLAFEDFRRAGSAQNE